MAVIKKSGQKNENVLLKQKNLILPIIDKYNLIVFHKYTDSSTNKNMHKWYDQYVKLHLSMQHSPFKKKY